MAPLRGGVPTRLPAVSVLLVELAAISLRGVIKCAAGQVTVLEPKTLIDKQTEAGLVKGAIPGSTATFGAPTYGQSFTGILWYVPDTENMFCTDAYIARMQTLQSQHKSLSASLRNIFILERGTCSFVSKVVIAEIQGRADCVLIVDTAESPIRRESLKNYLMADDGHGIHINIPSILITAADGRTLIDSVTSGMGQVPENPVIVKVEWSLPQQHVVTVDIWTDAGKTEGVQFLKQYASHATKLSGRVDFRIHYNVVSLPYRDPASELCLSADGLYCDSPPDGASGITGKEVLRENLRQICIRRVTEDGAGGTFDGDAPSVTPKWWQYVEQYPDACPFNGPTAQGPETEANKANRLSEACSNRLMNSIGIDTAAVARCAEDEYVKLLSQELGDKAWNIVALRINSVRYTGNMEPIPVTTAVCSAFETPPEACKELLAVQPSSIINAPGNGISFASVFFLAAALLVGVVVGLAVYQRHIRKSMRASLRNEVMLEVKAQMQEYYQMGDELNLPDDFREARPILR